MRCNVALKVFKIQGAYIYKYISSNVAPLEYLHL
jgi:hypothetical protein